MTAPRPKAVRPGERITAEKWNGLVAYLESGAYLHGGDGVHIHRGSTGVIVALAAAFGEYFKPAVITEVFGQEGDRIQNVRYSAQVIRKSAATLTNVLPKFGRAGDFDTGPAIKPAAVNSPCWIVSWPQPDGTFSADLCLMPGSEKLLGFECVGTNPPPDPLPLTFKHPLDPIIPADPNVAMRLTEAQLLNDGPAATTEGGETGTAPSPPGP